MKLGEIVERLIIEPVKLTEYALNYEHPVGKDKAIMFERYLGFTKDNYQLLSEQIKNKVVQREATFKSEDRYGERYQVNLEIIGMQKGQKETVCTGWIVKDKNARLVTLYISRRK